jgi:hypothetical protein
LQAALLPRNRRIEQPEFLHTRDDFFAISSVSATVCPAGMP